MTRSRILMAAAAAAFGLAFAQAPSALADDMSHGAMSKGDHMMNKKGKMKSHHMKKGKMSGEKKDMMKKDDMSK